MPYPEHEKLSAIKQESQAIGEFLDTAPYVLCEVADDRLWPVGKPINDLLAAYFGIDPDRLEREKSAMLEDLRFMNTPTPARPVTRAVRWPADWA